MRARERKAAGMDWTEVLAVDAENERARLAAEILASEAYPSTMEKVRAFVQQGGGSRSPAASSAELAAETVPLSPAVPGAVCVANVPVTP